MSLLLQNLKMQKLHAMKAGNNATRDTLGLVIGATDQLDSEVTDEKIYGIIRKQIKGCEETLKILEGGAPSPGSTCNPPWVEDPKIINLHQEIWLLNTFLPKSMSAEDIEKFIADNSIDVKSAKNEGQAVGAVMKALKAANMPPADGTTVKEVIAKLKA